MGKSLSRKERRKLAQQTNFQRHMKKSATVIGTTVTACSVVTPLMPLMQVQADEVGTEVVAPATAETVDSTVVQEQPEAETPVEQPVAPVETPTTEVEQPVQEEVVEQPTEEVVVEEHVEETVPASETTDDTDVTDTTEEVISPYAVAAYSAPNTSAFIEQMGAYAKPVADANDLYASVMIAQAIIESGWGQSLLSQAPYHNLFGIKGSYNGQTVYMNTQEFINGRYVTMKEPFRKYPSFQESFQDNANTLRNVSLQPGVYYYAGAWKSNTSSYRDATAWLTGRYATDPNYSSTLNRVIESYNLTRFDSPASGNSGGMTNTGTGGNSNSGSNNSNNTTPPTNNSGTYTIKAGDTLSIIASQYGVSVSQLKTWNNLSSDLIYVGQTLKVSQNGSGTSKPKPNTPNNNQDKPTTPNKPNTSSGSYTVKSGDSIWLIANNHGISMDQLRSWNNLSGDMIYVGQTLKVSQSGSTNKPSTPNNNQNKPTPNKPTTSTYTIKSGDTLSIIASKYGVSVNQLKTWNNLSSDLIFVGQTLKVNQNGSGTSKPNNNQNKPTPNKPTTSTYTIKSGDTLSIIASQYGVSVSQLKTWNNLSSDLIFVGQTLKVSQNGSGTSKPNNNQSKPTPNKSTRTYTIKSGDTLSVIASQYGVSVSQLKTWNNLSSDLIFVGQTLKVNKNSSTQSTSTSRPTSNKKTNAKTHAVKSGDSLWLLSQTYGTSINQLKALNGLSSDIIYVGQTLKVG
ncbi:LysM peptidoglycan-binding domain-containing protein [Enterococcus saccharolyticus]|uniref:LysM peptidoglycan-binding domain-containing protein n=1 Tax=Enterococcus saccharolyticus TaxID=41997 RepID=UPI001E2AAB7C|nr:LysM peptidoglycan-binding domain-containing protein [Enterococcus saccharolyticus]MCD5001336.1 LysM peptidoglycan-binding domain-containing protein [Enterococcus saccharolyticus]